MPLAEEAEKLYSVVLYSELYTLTRVPQGMLNATLDVSQMNAFDLPSKWAESVAFETGIALFRERTSLFRDKTQVDNLVSANTPSLFLNVGLPKSLHSGLTDCTLGIREPLEIYNNGLL